MVANKIFTWVKSHFVESVIIASAVGFGLYYFRIHAFATSASNHLPVGGGAAVHERVPPIVKPQPARISRQEPERFQEFDHRFEVDRMEKGAVDFRTELDDDERRRFLPRILSARGVDIPLVEFIFGLAYNDEIAQECVTYPDAPGIWEIATNGCWVPVTQADELLIEQIALERGDRQAPVVIMG